MHGKGPREVICTGQHQGYECVGFLAFHFRRDIFGGCVLRGRIVLNGGRDGVTGIVSLVLDERVWERDADELNIICFSEGCFYMLQRPVS